MSNVIKSFRIVETKSSQILKGLDNEDVRMKEILVHEAKVEYEKIINDAKEESLKILENTEKQNESMINSAYDRAKEILKQSKEKGYNEGYEIGHNQGYEKGYSEGKAISDNLVKESIEIKNGYIYLKDNLLKELEEDIIELVVNIYEKILNEKTEEDNEMIISLVLNGIRNLDLTDKLTIIASKEDFDILEMSKDEILAKASMISELVIKYDISLGKGDCILETSKGSIDVSIKNQLDEVKELLTTILNNE